MMMKIMMMMMMKTLFNESETVTAYASNIIIKLVARKIQNAAQSCLERNICTNTYDFILISFPTTNMSISKHMVKYKKNDQYTKQLHDSNSRTSNF